MSPMGAILVWLINVYMLIVVVRAILSWFGPSPRNPVVRILERLTDPVLEPIRRMLGTAGPVDFSPLIAILILMMLRYLVERFL